MTSSVRERPRSASPGSGDDSVRQRPSAAGRTIALVTAVALVAFGVVLWLTPVLGLRAVEVGGTGGAVISAPVAADVRAAVAVAEGTPLARVDLGAVRDRVLAVDSVSTATVARQWPNTLVVTVSERIAVATTQANGRWWLLDATGTPFRALPGRPDGLMPVQLATPGEGDRATLAALGVLASLSPELRATVAGVSAATAYDVTLFLTGGGSVIWGSDSDAAAKNAAVPAMLRIDRGAAGRILDVSDPTLVTVRAAP